MNNSRHNKPPIPNKTIAHVPAQMQVQTQQQIKTIFDPEIVQKYSEMVPSAPERILTVLEANNKAEREFRELPYQETKRRDWMSFILIISILASSIFFAWLEKPWLAGGTLTTFLAIVVSYFVGKARKP